MTTMRSTKLRDVGGASGPSVPLPPTAENVAFVTPRGDDANDGRSLASAKATLAAALATGATHITLGYGSIPIGAAADISTAGTVITGLGMLNTKLVCTTALDHVLKIVDARECTLRDFTVVIDSGGVVSHGIIVTATVSTEQTLIENVGVRINGSGTMTNGVSIGHDVSVDVADTTLLHVRSYGATSAAFRIGNGTAGNVLNTHFFGCLAAASAYGVYADGSGYTWEGGDVGNNTTADFGQGLLATNPVLITGCRSEGSARFFDSSSNVAVGSVHLRGVYVSQFTEAAGKVIRHLAAAPLTITGCVFKDGPVPVSCQIAHDATHPVRLNVIGTVTDGDTPFPQATGCIRHITGLEKWNGTGIVPLADINDDNVMSVVVKTSGDYTAKPNEMVITNFATGSYTISPPANPVVGTVFAVKRIDATATITTIGATVDGVTNPTLTKQYEAVYLVYNGTDWSRFPRMSLSSLAGFPAGVSINDQGGGNAQLQGPTGILTIDGDRILIRSRNGATTLIDFDGAANKLGFFGATRITKPAVTGSRGGNAALASLLTQLATLGLITDSSSA